MSRTTIEFIAAIIGMYILALLIVILVSVTIEHLLGSVP
jgi:hypothetical protein